MTLSFLLNILAIGALPLAFGAASDRPGVQTPHEFRGKSDPALGNRYLLYLPENYERETKLWPLIFFLHGAGERGADLELVKRQGLPRIVESIQGFPFIVLSPQCPPAMGWSREYLLALLDDIAGKYRADPGRIYLTGISMGGYVTWNLAILHPNRFAAIAPICGGGDPHLAHRLAHLPVWAFHGARDTIVPLSESEEMVEAVRKAGGDVRFTVYPDAGHDSWTPSYSNPDLYDWFLQHRRWEG